jgi:anti-sigma-K factor RskA
MSDQRHEEVKSLIAAYVMGAVPLEETPFIRAHILSCDECFKEADALSEVSAALALDVTPAPLPVGFADRVMAAAIGAPETTERAQQRVMIPTPQRRRWGLAPAFGALALVIVLVVGAVTIGQYRRTIDRQEKALAAILSSDEGMHLTGPNGAIAAIVPTDSGATFIAYGFDDAPSERTYQLWLMQGEEPVSAGTFEVEDGLAVLETSTHLDDYDGAAVTIEPEGGSLGPTGMAVATSNA